jgi:hypothetical protein
MVIKYFKKDSIVYLQGTCQGDTFYINKKVFVKIPALVPKPPTATFKEKVIIWVTNGLALIGIMVLVILGFRYIISKLSK